MTKTTKTIMLGLAFSMFSVNATAATQQVREVIKMNDIKKIERIIYKENSLAQKVEQYILQTADLDPTPTKIKNYFGMFDRDLVNFEKTGDISFSLENSSVLEFTNVVRTDKSYYNIYKFSKMREHTTTLVESSKDNKLISVSALHVLSPNTVKFIKDISILNSDYFIGLNPPTSKVRDWLKPTGDGLFIRNKYNFAYNKWIIIENNTDTIYINSSEVPDIQKYNSIEGQLADYKNVNGMIEEYIYINGKWYKTSTNIVQDTTPVVPVPNIFEVYADVEQVEPFTSVWIVNKIIYNAQILNCTNDLNHCGPNQDIRVACTIAGDYKVLHNCKALNYSCTDLYTCTVD